MPKSKKHFKSDMLWLWYTFIIFPFSAYVLTQMYLLPNYIVYTCFTYVTLVNLISFPWHNFAEFRSSCWNDKKTALSGSLRPPCRTHNLSFLLLWLAGNSKVPTRWKDDQSLYVFHFQCWGTKHMPIFRIKNWCFGLASKS